MCNYLGMSNYLGVKEMAAALGVDPTTVHRRIKRGELVPSTRVGKRPLFSEEDADRLARGEQHLPEDKEVAR